LQQDFLEARHFYLDVEKGLLRVPGEHLPESWKIFQFACTGASYFPSVARGVMAHHGSAVCCQPQVEFETIAAVREGQIEGFERVFRHGSGGAGTAVAEE